MSEIETYTFGPIGAGRAIPCKDGEFVTVVDHDAAIRRAKAEGRQEAKENYWNEAAMRAACSAHRACCGIEANNEQGKIHGYCVVCGVPWPCETAQVFLFKADHRRVVEGWERDNRLLNEHITCARADIEGKAWQVADLRGQLASLTIQRDENYQAVLKGAQVAKEARGQLEAARAALLQEGIRQGALQTQVAQLTAERDIAQAERNGADERAQILYKHYRESMDELKTLRGLVEALELQLTASQDSLALCVGEREQLKIEAGAARMDLGTLETQLAAERKAYNELIQAVGNKYPGETRHQTALRYIRQAEIGSHVAATLAQAQPNHSQHKEVL